MQNKGIWITVGVLAAVLIVGVFLMGQRGTTTQPTPATTQEVPVPGTDTDEMTVEEEGEATEVTVRGEEYSYSPSSLDLEAGQTVRITFENTGTLPHNLTVEGLAVATQTIMGGDTDTVEFTAPESGTYTFFCSVGNHRQLGMEGELSVE